MPTLSPLVAPEFVGLANVCHGTTNGDRVDIMTTLGFQCNIIVPIHFTSGVECSLENKVPSVSPTSVPFTNVD